MLIVKDEEIRPSISKWRDRIIVYLLTIGLSGFLLLFVPKQPTPDVTKVQVVQEPIEIIWARDAEMKRLDEIAATISTMSHDIDALKTSASGPIAVKVIELPDKPKSSDTPPVPPKPATDKKKSQ